ncbi:hypothetical protein Ciccas_006494 [Cichlidogyrus casuarinus]|uniref:Uncharacterized protein n=1 Tax=Cichlidogyrus casuarinus TaxID=1844966 RepID=A0ABD2Q9E5_9PLAT
MQSAYFALKNGEKVTGKEFDIQKRIDIEEQYNSRLKQLDSQLSEYRSRYKELDVQNKRLEIYVNDELHEAQLEKNKLVLDYEGKISSQLETIKKLEKRIKELNNPDKNKMQALVEENAGLSDQIKRDKDTATTMAAEGKMLLADLQRENEKLNSQVSVLNEELEFVNENYKEGYEQISLLKRERMELVKENDEIRQRASMELHDLKNEALKQRCDIERQKDSLIEQLKTLEDKAKMWAIRCKQAEVYAAKREKDCAQREALAKQQVDAASSMHGIEAVKVEATIKELTSKLELERTRTISLMNKLQQVSMMLGPRKPSKQRKKGKFVRFIKSTIMNFVY